MNLTARPSQLFKWTCPDCLLTFRTRDYVFTQREARWHAWDQHRARALGVPTPCLWDARIHGRRCLVTQPDGTEV